MFEPGTQIGRYEIHRKLGRGGMGTVYVAHDPVLGRMVAIKVFASDLDLPDAGERFTREARSAAALSHPNIVTVYDFGEFESQPYIVMEYVAGETLAHVIRRKADLSLGDKVRWIEELCAGVGFAHGRSVIHRDIKPANLMIDRSDRLKILDFGIARILGTASKTTSMMGTPGYMAPEQIEGGAVDHRADLFSIGVVLYELLAGTEAFPGETPAAITYRILSQDPVSLRQLVPDLHPDLVEICERAIRKAPSERFDRVETMRTALVRVRSELDLPAEWATAVTTIGRPTGLGFAPAVTPAPVPSTRTSGAVTPSPHHDAAGARRTPARTPGARRTSREALARRRGEWLGAALADARSHLERGNLQDALEACQRALTFDEDHVEALELEQAILSAFERAEATAATMLDAGPGDTTSETATFPSGPTLGPASRGMPGERGTALDMASGVATLDPASFAPRARAPRTPATVPIRDAAPVRLRLALLAGGLLVVAALVAAVLSSPGPSVPTGTVVIDAAPWASIVSIETESGDPVPLPPSVSTPLQLQLAAGAYRVVLAGPPPATATERVEVTVAAGTTSVTPMVEFGSVSVEEYFEQHLRLGDGR